MKIHLGSDHAGFNLKNRLAAHLKSNGYSVEDHGVHTADRADYPDLAAPVGRAVRDDASSLGVLVCGSGLGICMAANKVHGIRAASAWNTESAHLARAHNNANVICLGERLIPEADAIPILDAFLAATFEGGRHTDRIDKLAKLETAEADSSGNVGH
jgi:ribose 5-phosphate isomerase B